MSENGAGSYAAVQRGRLDRLAGLREQAATLLAAEIDLLADLAEEDPAAQRSGRAEQFLVVEIAGTLQVSQGSATLRTAQAQRYREALPLTVELLRAGRLPAGHARCLLELTASCATDTARAVEARLLPGGAQLNLVDFRRLAARLTLEMESETDRAAAEERRRAARAARAVWVRAIEDGMSAVGALLPGDAARAWQLELDELVRREVADEQASGGTRTATQIRADIFTDLPRLVRELLDGTSTAPCPHHHPDEAADPQPGAELALRPAGTVQPTRPRRWAPCHCPSPGRAGRPQVTLIVHVPVTTLLDLSEHPGQLDGYGPISAEHARLLLPDATLVQLLVDQHTGRPLRLDPHPATPGTRDPAAAQHAVLDLISPQHSSGRPDPGHDPSVATRRLVTLRDQHCDGPGCSVPATRCDLDHHAPWPAGPTHPDNLKARSRRCHRAKHAGWTVDWHPDGSTTWTSPHTGRSYTQPAAYHPPPALPPDTTLPPPRGIPPEELPRPPGPITRAGTPEPTW